MRDRTARHDPNTAPAAHVGTAAKRKSPSKALRALWACFGAYWALLAIAPFDRFDWLLENLLVFAFAAFLVGSRRTLPLSAASHVLIVAFLSLHAVGAHYTYSETPVGFWWQEIFAADRNHFDRAVHFAFGLLLFLPIREIIVMTARPQPGWSTVFAVTSVVFFGAIYEIIEWITAELVSPEAAMAYLGTQGDVFDVQKDAALAFAGALLAALAAALRPPVRRRKASPTASDPSTSGTSARPRAGIDD